SDCGVSEDVPGTPAGGGNLTGGSAPNSNTESDLADGSYSFQATYSGDGNYTGSTSTCESFGVGIGHSSTTTQVDDASTNAAWSGSETTGASAYDTASVVPSGSETATGSVSYTFFSNGTCSGTGTPAGGGNLSSGSAPNSNTESNLAAASYSFEASYSGDGNYTGSTSTCESFSVGKGSSSTTTQVDDASTNTAWSGSETTGASAYDTATVSPSDNITATGSVSYTFFSNGTCSGSGASAGGGNLTGGSAPNSSTETGLDAGSYGFEATWSGDSNYTGSTSSCESFSVGAAGSSTRTQPESSSAALGSYNKDVATITGHDSAADAPYPTGKVTFYSCGENVDPCTSATWTELNQVTLGTGTGNTNVATSASFTPTSTGTWCFAAVYSGDSNYTGSSDDSTDECYDVSPGSTTNITTPANATINLGQVITDLSTITGNAAGGSPSGSVSFYVCGPYYNTPGSCTSQSDQVGSAVTVSSGSDDTSTATSATFQPTTVGYWCFAADYSGSSQYQTSSDTSADECFFVEGPLTIVTSSCPSGTVRHAYSCQMQAAGGTEPYRWSMTGGPAENATGGDLRINRSTGLITGTPHRAATYTITVKVRDSSHPRQHAKQVFTITINS
ncbi:MAG TPA: Ig-like domain-containing protein, partial [Acidimicrobiales bacterium]|nr:Ig-like domain-containing protein [Acidimicrobiales bacterium]